jgi:phospholipid/cholesterol/gamma-HCH transport system permease protein
MYKNSKNQQLIKMKTALLSYDDNLGFNLSGDWVWASIHEETILNIINNTELAKNISIDATDINNLDTCGMYFIDRMTKVLNDRGVTVSSLTIPDSYQQMFDTVYAKLNAKTEKVEKVIEKNLIESFGNSIINGIDYALDFVAFLGQFIVSFIKVLKSPLNLNIQEVARTIGDAGLSGMWVVALLCFLIGVTLAYEMSPQFITYGANVYIVNFLGISLLKEVAPLLTGVIVAGRTGASITAEIGTQKLQEEIDAIKTMGISPMTRIVIPKIIGVMIAVPLITAVGDIVSMLGGAIVAKPMLGISYSLFLSRMQEYLAVSNYASGIIKSIAFAFLVSVGGCYCGFKVKGNANSIGEQTTNSVVLGIVLILFCDAVFAIIFNAIGW